MDRKTLNQDGYKDLTAYQALKNIEAEERAEARVKKLLATIFLFM